MRLQRPLEALFRLLRFNRVRCEPIALKSNSCNRRQLGRRHQPITTRYFIPFKYISGESATAGRFAEYANADWNRRRSSGKWGRASIPGNNFHISDESIVQLIKQWWSITIIITICNAIITGPWDYPEEWQATEMKLLERKRQCWRGIVTATGVLWRYWDAEKISMILIGLGGDFPLESAPVSLWGNLHIGECRSLLPGIGVVGSAFMHPRIPWSFLRLLRPYFSPVEFEASNW